MVKKKRTLESNSNSKRFNNTTGFRNLTQNHIPKIKSPRTPRKYNLSLCEREEERSKVGLETEDD